MTLPVMSQRRTSLHERRVATKERLAHESAHLRRRVEALEAQLVTRERADRSRRRILRNLRRQGAVLAELAKSDEIAREDFASFARLASARAAVTLGVERSSVWLFSPDCAVLRCETLYEAGAHRHSRAPELQAVRYPRYFAALARGRVVAADDALRDPATREFADSYLVPLGIGAMLDAPIRRAGSVIGAVCHEHVGGKRGWLPEEREFAASVAEFVSLALETNERRRAEEGFRRAQSELLFRQQQEKHLAQAELERLEGDLVRRTHLATLGQVAASIAHELRNPLGAIRNATYYLQRHAQDGSPKRNEYLGIIDHEVAQADRIVSDLLEMSRPRTPSKRGVDLETLARDAFEYLHDPIGVSLVCALAPDPFEVFADPEQVRQVLANLFTNSLQAFESGAGRITVGAARDGDVDLITVADDGPGIPSALRRQIFEPLFTTRAKGTGLGLAICRQIVQAHGGSLQLADSVRGAVFFIRIPTRPGEAT